MKKLNVQSSTEVSVSADQVFQVIGNDFVNIGSWGRGINKSWENKNIAKKFEDAPAGGRFCEVDGFGTMDERILHFNAKDNEITWSADGKKIPGFVRGLQNEIKVVQLDENTALVTSHITADLKGIGGWLFGGKIQKNFSKVLGGFMTDLKTFSETGEPSNVKKRQLQN
jgi:hypothetical protein